jgi:hypothetical protein
MIASVLLLCPLRYHVFSTASLPWSLVLDLGSSASCSHDQSGKISHIDIVIPHIGTVIFHIDTVTLLMTLLHGGRGCQL